MNAPPPIGVPEITQPEVVRTIFDDKGHTYSPELVLSIARILLQLTNAIRTHAFATEEQIEDERRNIYGWYPHPHKQCVCLSFCATSGSLVIRPKTAKLIRQSAEQNHTPIAEATGAAEGTTWEDVLDVTETDGEMKGSDATVNPSYALASHPRAVVKRVKKKIKNENQNESGNPKPNRRYQAIVDGKNFGLQCKNTYKFGLSGTITPLLNQT
ncbi:hypothetical protein DFH07DRAFT_784918 [Mycena maculata]|uniref:Uncharacterized protein n=1 Tax=Mycena maculata TaxID=230809 RepID=A0AAD7HEU3_9AGAR|nr:hypothetical protein DFH07DRAFT_784918 [Mycena maculata]